MNHRNRLRALSRALVVALVAAFLVTPRGPAEAKRWEDDKLNVVLEIPDDPYPWEWIPYSSSFDKYDIKKAARRVVSKYRTSGKEAKGEGARLDLVVRDIGKDDKLDQLAADAKIRKFFLGRFQKHGEVEIAETDLIGDVPARALTVDGTAKNLKGKAAACHGMMVVAVLRQRLYLLRMYAWHTEFDEEGLKGDLDFIGADGLSFQITSAVDDAPKGNGPPPPPPDEEPDEPDEDEIIWFKAGQLRMVRDGRLLRKDITKRERRSFLILKLEGNSHAGSHQFFLYGIPNSRVVDGVQANAEDIKKGITTTWYSQFLASHPTGTIFKFKWPKKGPYLTLPELKEENRAVVFDGKKKKRDLKPSQTEIIKKLGIIEKSKKARIGDEKSGEAFRGNLQGLQDGLGKVTTLRFSWRAKTHSYRIIVTIARDGYLKYGDALRKTLESIYIYKKLPKNCDQEIEEQKTKNAELAARREAQAKAAADKAAADKAAEEAAKAAEERAKVEAEAEADRKAAEEKKPAEKK